MTRRNLNRREVIGGAAAVGGTLLTSDLLAGCTGERGDEIFAEPAATAAKSRQYRFPDNFLWGAGTSGLQHEGSPLADGTGRSAMYRWAHAAQGKKVAKPDWFTPPIHTFDVSADFYQRYQRDIQLMREMNLRAYNFEVYWPRILPEGTGKVNKAGLDFYDRVVDEFLAADIVPLCNLYVFDHPAALQDRGGWLNRDMASWFADYATILYERLGDRIPYWSTICEIPLVHAYTAGWVVPAPRAEVASASIEAVHHLLLGQGMAIQALRASGAIGEIGNQHNLAVIQPASDDEDDVLAASRENAASNLLYLDSQLRGEYPRDLIEWYGPKWPAKAIREGDLATISAPIDYFGLNYGTGQIVRHDSSEAGGLLQTSNVEKEASPPYENTAGDVHASLLWVRERYGDLPIYILEAGEGLQDEIVNGEVDDFARLTYLQEYTRGLHRALQDGVDLRGCFVWSFLDGWEFGFGLSLRYGIVYVDFGSQRRIIKRSGKWFRDMIAANGFERAEITIAD